MPLGDYMKGEPVHKGKNKAVYILKGGIWEHVTLEEKKASTFLFSPHRTWLCILPLIKWDVPVAFQ